MDEIVNDVGIEERVEFPQKVIKTRKKRAFLVFFLVFILSIGLYRYLSKSDSKISNNFETDISFFYYQNHQTKPVAYIKGKRETLPTSQVNLWVPEQKKLVVCGSGGLYVYDPVMGKINYLYESSGNKDWYPCDLIFETRNQGFIYVKDHDGSMIIDLKSQTVVERDVTNFPSPLSDHVDNFDKKYYTFYNKPDTENKNEVCDLKGKCARLIGSFVNFYENGHWKNKVEIDDVFMLKGFRDGILFYLKITEPGAWSNIYSLHAFDVNSGEELIIGENITSDINFVFIDGLKSDKLVSEYNYDSKDNVPTENIGDCIFPVYESLKKHKSAVTIPERKGSSSTTIPKSRDIEHVFGDQNSTRVLVFYCSPENSTCMKFLFNEGKQLIGESKDALKVIYRPTIRNSSRWITELEAAKAGECVSEMYGEEMFWSFIEKYTVCGGPRPSNRFRTQHLPYIAEEIGADKDKIAECIIRFDLTDRILSYSHENDQCIGPACVFFFDKHGEQHLLRSVNYNYNKLLKFLNDGKDYKGKSIINFANW